MATAKLQLLYPVTMADGSIIKALLARTPTPPEIDDLKGVAAGSRELRMAAYARFTDSDRAVVDELDFEDLLRLDDLLGELFHSRSQ